MAQPARVRKKDKSASRLRFFKRRNISRLSDWTTLIVAICSGLGAVLVPIWSSLTPDFLVEYEEMRSAPIPNMTSTYDFKPSEIITGRARVLHVRVKNNNESKSVRNTELIIQNYIERLSFVIDGVGKSTDRYKFESPGTHSVLTIPLGSIPPNSEINLYVGGDMSYLFASNIQANADNFENAVSRELGSVSGFRLFVARYFEWIASLVLLLVGTILLLAFSSRNG